MEKPIQRDISGIMSIMVMLVWLAVLAASASCSPSAFVATWLFIFWLIHMDAACRPAETTGMRNRPISPQPSHSQNLMDGMPDRSMPRNWKFMACRLAFAVTASALRSSMNSPM